MQALSWVVYTGPNCGERRRGAPRAAAASRAAGGAAGWPRRHACGHALPRHVFEGPYRRRRCPPCPCAWPAGIRLPAQHVEDAASAADFYATKARRKAASCLCAPGAASRLCAPGAASCLCAAGGWFTHEAQPRLISQHPAYVRAAVPTLRAPARSSKARKEGRASGTGSSGDSTAPDRVPACCACCPAPSRS